LGLALGHIIIRLLQRLSPANLPRLDEIGIDWTVLLFTVSISVLCGVQFGLIAVVRVGATSAAALKQGGRTASDGRARHRTRNALAAGQVALALMLLIVSGLMIRTFVALRQVQPGFTNPEEVQTFRIALPEGVISSPEQSARRYQEITERLAQTPGVVSVGLSSSITMDGEDNGNVLDVENFPVPEGEPAPMRRFKSFAPGYFEAMGIPLTAGRSIIWAEIYEQRPVILISETIAREYWGEPTGALGKRVRYGSGHPWREIVGVVGDERDDGLNHPPTPIVYWPLLNDTYESGSFAYAVRSTRVGAPGFLGELRQAVWSVDPTLPLSYVQTLEEIQADSLAQTSFVMVMLGVAAGVALLLGLVGIYGVIAYIATQRTREIGIRIALGAQVADVRRQLLRHGLLVTSVGIVFGIGASLVFSRVLSALLFGVDPLDPITYAAVSSGLAAVALIATWLPASRASRIDPVVALRADA
jgi:predicted permease